MHPKAHPSQYAIALTSVAALFLSALPGCDAEAEPVRRARELDAGRLYLAENLDIDPYAILPTAPAAGPRCCSS